MHLRLFAIISSLVVATMCQDCPAIYLRYSQNPTFCTPRNPQCKILKSGVNSAEMQQILDVHNSYRNTVANGKEKQAGGLPQAADMMQMVWDKELAAIAQKHAETCVYGHDDNNDRRVENFPVGQNIAGRTIPCQGDQTCIQQAAPVWPDMLKSFYDEVSRFNKNLVDSVDFNVPEDKPYGHFTQVVWSRSWRVGCGFVQYEDGTDIKQYYVCNYGPAGNTVNAPLYKRGTPCSACPTNSCCGKTCPNSDYNALCRMNSNSEAPAYPIQGTYIYYCDFSSQSGDCSVTSDGGPWKIVQALGGPFIEVVLNGGETSTLQMTRPLDFKKSQSCFLVAYRTGATVMGQNVDNKPTVSFGSSGGDPTAIDLPPSSGLLFLPMSITLPFTGQYKVSFTFSVPSGAQPQYFNIQLVSAKNGAC